MSIVYQEIDIPVIVNIKSSQDLIHSQTTRSFYYLCIINLLNHAEDS